MEINELQSKIRDLKERRHKVELSIARVMERREQAKKTIVDLDKKSRDTFGIPLTEIPEYIEKKKAEVESALDKYESELALVEERMKEIEG